MALPRSQRVDMRSLGSKFHRVRQGPLEVKAYGGNENQAAILIPKKVISSAVARNRIRRQCIPVLKGFLKDRDYGAIVVKLIKMPEQPIAEVLRACLEQLGNNHAK